MPRSTELLLPGLIPPKKEQAGDEKVGFLDILESVRPECLSEDVLSEFAKRDLYVTEADRDHRKKNTYNWRSQAPVRPVEERLRLAKFVQDAHVRDLRSKVEKYQAGARNGYENARMALIKAIGSKVNHYIVQREFDSMSDSEREEQKQTYEKWDQESEDRWEIDKARSRNSFNDAMYQGTRCEKVKRVRKGIRRKDGRYFTQQEFARLIGYPASKYREAEKYDEAVGDELREKLVMICHANPYYLFDDICYAESGEDDENGVERHGKPAIFTGYDSILKWILAGKPRVVSWTDEL